MDILTRAKFALPPDPWAPLDLATADAARAGALAGAAATHQAMAWILGERGSGKTRAVRAALEAAGAPVVEPLRLDRERLHMGDVQVAIVRDLSDERPRTSGEARSGQVRRVLGAASRPPVLWIDEAHALHHATVRGLKRLRELSWRGRAPLLGIVLSGQREPSARVAEVALRSDRLRLAGLTRAEAAEALRLALGEALSPDARELVAGDARARNWLDLQALGDACLRTAAARGLPRAGAAEAREALGRPDPSRTAPAAAPADDVVAARLSRSRRAA